MNSYQLRKLKIELTHRCDLLCLHCSSNAGKTVTTEIPEDTCLRIIADAAAMGVTDVSLSGGEPLLYPYLLTVVRLSVERGMRVSVYTTGIVAGFEEKAEELQKLGAKMFIFSLFSGVSSRHEAITQTKGSFERTCGAIRSTAELGLVVELHFVPLATNYSELGAVASLSAKLGASQVSVLRFVPHGRGRHLSREVLDARQNFELRESIIRLRDAGHKIRTGSPYNFLMLEKQPECRAAIDRLTIMPDMRIVPCDAFKQVHAEDIAGDNNFSSLTCTSLHECWTKSPYLKAVRDHLPPELADECLSCPAVKQCRSGCLAQKFLANGDLRRSRDPGCLMRE